MLEHTNYNQGSQARPTSRCRNFALCLVFLLAGMTTLGCDTNARFNINKITFDDLKPISVHPAVLENGTLVRQCGAGPVDGIIYNMALLSTERKVKPGSNANVDKDRSIRPGDIIATLKVDGEKPRDIKLSGTTNIQVKVDCLDALQSPELKDDTPLTCDGTEGTAVSLSSLTFEANSSDRASGHNLIVLMDMSGSMKGFVNQLDASDPNFSAANQDKENSPAKTLNIPGDLTTTASDYNSWRLTMVKELVDSLNTRDRFGMVGFGEGLGGDFMATPCNLPEATGQGWDDALSLCFGISNNDYWRSGIDSFQNKVKPGRSNLWEALTDVYGFLSAKKDLVRTNHILVINDGPDTCSKTEAFGNCQVPCSVGTHTDLLNAIAADAANPNAPKIHIHFVQFEAPGYPGADPRQMEVSCESGAHFQFINSNTIPKANSQKFQDALRTAVYNVRFSMMGHWAASLNSPYFADNSASGTEPGRIYAMSGTVTVKSGSNLKAEDQITVYDSSGTGLWDGRLRIRKSCDSDALCGGAGDADPNCHVICSSETLLCPYNSDGPSTLRPDGQACAVDDAGVCCEGECLAPGEKCDTCN